ncbi:protein SRC2 homolog [Nicotiana tomentosiformis]|uniref:protein SRC2 homolog n=1 Tax=Nicotiana tomentosiformis TaxID=4098 RepID=UPI00051AF887|nr:protein SRC2 homolog [Nicotiana tomentosiformis]
MEWRPFDITVLSADGIKNVNLFYPMDVYVEVSIFGYAKNKKKSFVDKKGGTCPRWNYPMKFTLDEPSLTKPDLSLFFRLRSNRFFGDKDIGIVTIPIQELFTDSTSNDEGSAERIVEYQVFTAGTRKPKGTVKFAYKFGKKFAHNQHINGYPALPAGTQHVNHQLVTGYPQTHMPPVWCGTSSTGMTYHQHHPGGYSSPGYGEYGGYPTAMPPPGYPPTGYDQYPPPPGYGYNPPMQQQVQQPNNNKGNKFGAMGVGLGLGAGLVGGALVGHAISDAMDDD